VLVALAVHGQVLRRLDVLRADHILQMISMHNRIANPNNSKKREMVGDTPTRRQPTQEAPANTGSADHPFAPNDGEQTEGDSSDEFEQILALPRRVHRRGPAPTGYNSDRQQNLNDCSMPLSANDMPGQTGK